MTSTTDRLWFSNTGRMTCDRHGGAYMTSALADRPKANKITTPLDVWEVATAVDLAAFEDACEVPAFCETCGPR